VNPLSSLSAITVPQASCCIHIGRNIVEDRAIDEQRSRKSRGNEALPAKWRTAIDDTHPRLSAGAAARKKPLANEATPVAAVHRTGEA
jgi:hypothetical protein